MKTLNPTEEQTVHNSIVPGPHWDDACGHSKGSYVCTFTVLNHQKYLKKDPAALQYYDLYIFPQHYWGEEVCLRYGNQGHQYISPGPIAQFIHNAGAHGHVAPEYRVGAEILRNMGTCSWEPRRNKTTNERQDSNEQTNKRNSNQDS